MTAYDPPKPVIVHPEVGWTARSTLRGCDWTRKHHEGITAQDGKCTWVTPGWSMSIMNDHDMNRARALAMGLGDKARCDILEAAWSLCRRDK